MPNTVPVDAVVVSDSALKSTEPYDLVQSNINFINALRDQLLGEGELAPDAEASYYVDFYLAQLNNGGFSQFVFNSRWEPKLLEILRYGLRSIGAKEQLRLFEVGAYLVDALPAQKLKEFFASEYFGENPTRDLLDAPTKLIFNCKEDLIALNHAWLKNHPKLVVLTWEEMEAEAKRRGAALPDRAERMAIVEAKQPRYVKLTKALCEKSGHPFDTMTAGNFEDHEGERIIVWHFLADGAHYRLLDVKGKAYMINDANERICEIDAPESIK